MSSIKWETADEMMNVLCFAAITAAVEENEPITIDEAVTFAQSMFQKYCDTFGITEVEDPEEDTDEEDTDEDPDFTATLEIELDPTIVFEDDDDFYEDDEEEDEDEDEEEDYRANDDCFTLSDLLNFFNEAL